MANEGGNTPTDGLAMDGRRQPDLYWRQIEQLKAACIAMRLYRNQMHRRLRAVDLVKAISGNGAIAAWAVFKDYPLLWSGIIGAAQFLDAIKGVFPFTSIHKQASNLTAALELLLIDAEEQWENIYAGALTEAEIRTGLSRIRRLKVETEHKHFPDGFELPTHIIALATQEARDYFLNIHA
jgi:hypothetical protein